MVHKSRADLITLIALLLLLPPSAVCHAAPSYQAVSITAEPLVVSVPLFTSAELQRHVRIKNLCNEQLNVSFSLSGEVSAYAFLSTDVAEIPPNGSFTLTVYYKVPPFHSLVTVGGNLTVQVFRTETCIFLAVLKVGVKASGIKVNMHVSVSSLVGLPLFISEVHVSVRYGNYTLLTGVNGAHGTFVCPSDVPLIVTASSPISSQSATVRPSEMVDVQLRVFSYEDILFLMFLLIAAALAVSKLRAG